MLNIGITEILAFGIIALLILGPDKLPEAIRFITKWYHQIKRMMNNVQQDIDRELRVSELRSQIQEEMQRIQQLEYKMQLQLNDLQQNLHLSDHTSMTQNLNSTVQYQLISEPKINLFNYSHKKDLHQISSSAILKNHNEYQVAV